jgi:hypothetical protein
LLQELDELTQAGIPAMSVTQLATLLPQLQLEVNRLKDRAAKKDELLAENKASINELREQFRQHEVWPTSLESRSLPFCLHIHMVPAKWHVAFRAISARF